jgi:hypothetical protein
MATKAGEKSLILQKLVRPSRTSADMICETAIALIL